MKKEFMALASAAFLLGVVAAETNELETAEVEKTDGEGLTVEVSMDVLSDYIWRGTICNGNPVWQPSVVRTAGNRLWTHLRQHARSRWN